MQSKQGEYSAVPKDTSKTSVQVVAAEPKKVENFEVTSTWERGEIQEPGYKDVHFAIAFLCQLFAVVMLGILFATGVIKTSESDDTNRRLDDYESVYKGTNSGSNNYVNEAEQTDDSFGAKQGVEFLAAVIVSLIASPIVSVAALGLMKNHAVFLITFSLWFVIGLNAFLAVTAIFYSPGAAIFHIIVASILACYLKAVQHRIPYAAANLRSAISAIKMNLGVALLSFSAIPVRLGWLVIWFYAIYNTLQTDFMKEQVEEQTTYGDAETEETISPLGWFVICLFVLSLYWTSEVIKNTIHTTIAGVIGTWWFLPEEASTFCSKGLTDSLARSTTYSFGSICLGSLIVAILELLKNSLRSARNNRNAGILRCVAICLLAWIERLVEYFNKWAFIYVGLYGYSYMEAGKKVLSLFQSRGWSTIISDNLVYRMLGMVCLAIGFISGLVCSLFALFGGDFELMLPFFFIGLLIGIVMSGFMMGAVASSVDAIIVLFAEAPTEFEENHPQLFSEMQATWTTAWGQTFSGEAGVIPEATVV